MKERWFNYRPLCLIFDFLLLGSVFSFYIVKKAVVTIVFTVIALSILTVIAILKKKPKYAIIPIISFVFGIGAYCLSIFNFNKSINYVPSTIQARICNISDERDGMIKVELDNCQFDNKKNSDNVILYIYDNSGLFKNIEIGNVIKFEPYRFYKSNLFYNKTPNAALFAKDLKYTASAQIENISYIETDKTLSEHFKEQIKDNLHLGLTNENAEIAYSALFGDKDMLSAKQYDVYKLSGVAHLLAVSGLHVGIIVAILTKLMNFKRSRRWWKLGVISVFLLIYTHLCGYSMSIIRASIMSIVLLISILTLKEYDIFNSIGLAGIFIFLINPLCVFDVAFLLSFSCVLGIAMLNKPINKLLEKLKVPKKLANSISVSLAATISIVFIMAYYFRTLNIISIIANVILIPIFTIAFTFIFVVSIISFILPFVSYLLLPINYILSFINLIATVLGNLAIANFNTLEFNYIAIILYFILLLFMGRFCTAKYEYKIITTLPMVALLVYCLV